MKRDASGLLAAFEQAAAAAEGAERETRRRAADEIAQAERRRVEAFRRIRLLRLLAGAGAECPSEDAALAAQARTIADERGWDPERTAHKEILDRLAPVGRSVWRCTADAASGDPTPVRDALAAFEHWFETTRGHSFYALFDQHVPEAPVVDF